MQLQTTWNNKIWSEIISTHWRMRWQHGDIDLNPGVFWRQTWCFVLMTSWSPACMLVEGQSWQMRFAQEKPLDSNKSIVGQEWCVSRYVWPLPADISSVYSEAARSCACQCCRNGWGLVGHRQQWDRQQWTQHHGKTAAWCLIISFAATDRSSMVQVCVQWLTSLSAAGVILLPASGFRWTSWTCWWAGRLEHGSSPAFTPFLGSYWHAFDHFRSAYFWNGWAATDWRGWAGQSFFTEYRPCADWELQPLFRCLRSTEHSRTSQNQCDTTLETCETYTSRAGFVPLSSSWCLEQLFAAQSTAIDSVLPLQRAAARRRKCERGLVMFTVCCCK